MLKSTLALMTRPNLRCHPQLAAVIPMDEAVARRVMLLGVNSKELKAATADDDGIAFLMREIQKLDFQRELARAAKLTLPEVARLALKTQRHSADDILKGIANSYPKELEIRVQSEVAALIPREEAEKRGILLERVSGTTVHALHTDGNGKQTLDMLFQRADFRKRVAETASIPEEQAGEIRCEARRVQRSVLDLEITRSYPRTRFEGLSNRDIRRHTQTVRKEWADQSFNLKTAKTTAESSTVSRTKQVFYDIVASAYLQEASDVRVSYDIQRKNIVHELFIDGVWKRQADIPLEFPVYQSIINMAKSDAGIPDIEPHRPHDGDIHFRVQKQGKLLEFDGRICIFPYTKTVARTIDLAMMTIRILRKNEEIRSLGELGLLPFQMRTVEKFVNASTGLLPVCGVMNSGKNGTLMAVSAAIHDRYPGKAFLSLEDPVETDIPFAFQTEVARRRGLKSSDYLASILRSNVQIIQMGEINDADKADFALKAAQSGHYTQCTIHAKSPFDVIPRLQMYGIPPAMLGEVLIGVIYQKLVPKLCRHCAVRESSAEVLDHDRYPNLAVVLEHWGVDARKFNPLRAGGMIDGKPCPHCSYQGRGTGYCGRIGLFEIWDASFQRKQLQDNTGIGDVRSTALKLNHWTILRSALCYVQAGVIDLETAMTVYNGIDPTYEGVPGYRFEDYEKHMRDLETEAEAFRRATRDEEADEVETAKPSRATSELDFIDAEIFEADVTTDDMYQTV